LGPHVARYQPPRRMNSCVCEITTEAYLNHADATVNAARARARRQQAARAEAKDSHCASCAAVLGSEPLCREPKVRGGARARCVGAQHPRHTAERNRRRRGGATACSTLTVSTFNTNRLLHCPGSSGSGAFSDKDSDVTQKLCRAPLKEITDWRVLSLLDLPTGTCSSTQEFGVWQVNSLVVSIGTH